MTQIDNTQLPTGSGPAPRACSASSDTPETDAAAGYATTALGERFECVWTPLARKLERQRDRLAAIMLRDAEEWDQAGDEIGARETRRIVREILSENDKDLARRALDSE